MVKGAPNVLKTLRVFIKSFLIDGTCLFKENLGMYVPSENKSWDIYTIH